MGVRVALDERRERPAPLRAVCSCERRACERPTIHKDTLGPQHGNDTELGADAIRGPERFLFEEQIETSQCR